MVKLRFLLDENISPRLVDVLKDLGFDAVHIQELRLKEAANGVIFRRSLEEKRIIITADEDFANTDKYPPGPGRIVLVFQPRTRAQVSERLKTLLKAIKPEEVKDAVIIVFKESWEIRKRTTTQKKYE